MTLPSYRVPNVNKDFLIEVAKENVSGHSLVHKYGRNDAVGATFEGVSLLSGAFNFLTSATTVRIKSGGNAADTAAGAGAQAITVEGLNDSLVVTSESIATAGAAASTATTALFWRVYRAFITPASVGAYGVANTGDVVIENSGGGTDLIKIAAGEGQSQYAAYAIPTGKTGYLLSVHLTSDGLKASDFRIFTRANLNDVTTPYEPKRLRLYWDGILGSFDYRPFAPAFSMAGGTDIWVEAQAAVSTEVTADFEILLVDD